MLTRKADAKGRVALGQEFANCLLTLQVKGDEVLIRKVKTPHPRKYTFRELMAGVTPENIHEEVDTGNPVGKETL